MIDETEGALVRHIFERFPQVGSAIKLVQEVNAAGHRTKHGKAFDKGILYKLLHNRTYVGEVEHKGTAYPGEQELELLEPRSEPVAIGVVLPPPRRPYRRTCDRLETLLKQWSVMQNQQSLGDVDTTIGVDPDQVVVEGSMVDFRECNAVGERRLAEQFIGIGHDVRRIEEMIIRQVADRAPVIVGGEHAVPEGCLMQPLLDQAEGIPALCCVRCSGYSSCPCKLAERDPRG